jgi:hypothetical protein
LFWNSSRNNHTDRTNRWWNLNTLVIWLMHCWLKINDIVIFVS